jgi:hypothetical protein
MLWEKLRKAHLHALPPLARDFKKPSFHGHAEFGGPLHSGHFDKRSNRIQIVGVSWQAKTDGF